MFDLLKFESILQLIEAFPTELSCYIYLESLLWYDGIVCPHCGSTHKFWRLKDQRMLKCSVCKMRFTVKTGTVFEETRLSLRKWFVAIFLISVHSKGISSVQLSKDLRITQKTAWFLNHRIRFIMNSFNEGEKLTGIIEVDEHYAGGVEKNKHTDKKTPNNQGRSTKTKTAVFGMVERAEKDESGNKIKNAKVIAYKVDNVKTKTLTNEIENNVEAGAKVMSDEYQSYRKLGYTFKHQYIRHNSAEYVRGNVHTNTIEGFWGLFKRMFIGIYHLMSNKHINRYLSALAFRYNIIILIFLYLT